MQSRQAGSSRFAIALWLCGLLPCVAGAQTFPSRPLQLVIPSAPGAAYDLIGRVIADGIRDNLGSVVVDNRAGGNFTIGAAYVKRAAPDGHTLMLGGNVYVIGEAMNLTRTYNFFEDFEPVGHLVNLPFYLVVRRESVPVNSLREFIDYVKARPGKLVYITPGNGALHHFAMESLKIEAGLDILHVPYKAMAQGVTDLVSGRVDMTITGYPAIAAQMAGGRLKILATVNPRRSEFLPDIPTFAEAGLPNYKPNSWSGLLGPAGLPKPIVDRLSQEIMRAQRSPEYAGKMRTYGIEPFVSTPDQFLELMKSDSIRYARVIKDANIRMD